MRSALSTMTGKLAAAAAGLTLAATGAAAASIIPTPFQTVTSSSVSDPALTGDTSTTLPATSTTLPDTSTTLPATSTTLPVTSTTLPATSTTLPVTPTTLAPKVLPPPATSAQEAAHIHAFDQACGNHGQYVSHVARFGTEPTCATDLRSGTTTAATSTSGGNTGDNTGAPASRGGKPANAGSQDAADTGN